MIISMMISSRKWPTSSPPPETTRYSSRGSVVPAAQITYGHTSTEHQHYIALYTVCLLYADDLGIRHLDALTQFSRRFSTGEKQLNPVLNKLTELMRQAYDLWPQVGADAIVSGTLEAVSAMYIECTSGDMKITPQATLWPNYFRNRSGICPPYAHFNFVKNWRSAPDSYLQLLPYLEFYIVAANDVLSFYKEQLAGETKNYIHIRATTDQMTPVDMLRRVADEVLACGERVELLIGDDAQLMRIWRSFEHLRIRKLM
ncbi:terpenoid synthase [Dichomitus squalens LYAD-421 SS1]|uniref:Terpenoid synthase n=1 Tax=Dichomitus squalens (strain LYAD-421) TaxID=732165 RepID=R7SYD2_DICSQ|nr:terpenoid synthase [Dichomitus squalens LYAD-421 SS1]EJF61101.1 terpenoid synthase [Dichomitus squalens LYAD-421 SS1]